MGCQKAELLIVVGESVDGDAVELVVVEGSPVTVVVRVDASLRFSI